jgi:TonB family protein
MSRLRTRCFIASAAAHGLLGLLLLAGAGFIGAGRPPESLPILTFVPDRLVDAMLVGGGSPQGSPTPTPMLATPPPAPPLASPAPAPASAPPKPSTAAKPAKPMPEKEPSALDLKEPKPGRKSPRTVKSSSADTEAGDRNKSGNKHQVEANLKPAVRKPSGQADEQTPAQAESAAWARQAAAAQRARITGAVTTLEGQLAGGSLSAVPFGPGGETYANYGLYLLSIYDWAWQTPEEISDESGTVKVKVVIARDGKVISSEILAKSGLAALDKSVRAALGRVDNIGKPFPEGAKEDQRVFIINFNLKARHRLG